MRSPYATALSRARKLALAQEFDAALSVLRPLVAADPTDADSLVLLGNTLIMSNNAHSGSDPLPAAAERDLEARRCFELAVAVRPDCVPALIDLADWHLDHGDPASALPLLASAERLLADRRAWESLELELADCRLSRQRAECGN